MDKIKMLIRLGDNIRTLREQRGWSQETLAAQAGMGRNYVGGLERGEINLGLESIVKLSVAFEISVCELLEGVA